MVLFGEMQKIFLFFIFSKAKMMPNVMLTGSPGGTVTVIKSQNFINKSKGSAYLNNLISKII